MSVYIPSRARSTRLDKVMPAWIEQDMDIQLVVPFGEYQAYVDVVRSNGWDVAVLKSPRSVDGIGATRRFIIEHAKKAGLGEIIMCDDDFKPMPDTDMWDLLDAAKDQYAVGVAASYGYNDFLSGGKLSELSGVILCPGGWGHNVYSLNVENVLGCGNFDAALGFYEDDELQREGVALGMPWLVHCDVWMTSLGKRGDAGGCQAPYSTSEDRAAAMLRCAKIVEKRWPKYVNITKAGYRMSWKKMLDDYIPGWQGLSAIHGGSLE